MSLKEYFENTKGFGVLSTAGSDGKVDSAVYARPHFSDEDTATFIMADKLSHENLKTNPHAAYLFKEDGDGYRGKRLFLTKTGEEENDEKLIELRRKVRCPVDEEGKRFIVHFKVDEVLPLVGSEK